MHLTAAVVGAMQMALADQAHMFGTSSALESCVSAEVERSTTAAVVVAVAAAAAGPLTAAMEIARKHVHRTLQCCQTDLVGRPAGPAAGRPAAAMQSGVVA